MVASYSPHRHTGETATLFNHPNSPSPSRHLIHTSAASCSSPFAITLSTSVRARSASRRSSPVKHRNGANADVGSPVKLPLAIASSNEIKSPKMTLRSGSSSPRTSTPRSSPRDNQSSQRVSQSHTLCSSNTESRGTSPLKRTEQVPNNDMSINQVSHGSPVAKKRNGNFALHTSSSQSPSFGSSPMSAFESGTTTAQASTTPKRSNSIKNPSAHIFEKPSFARSRPQANQHLDFSSSDTTTSRMRRVTSVENFLAPTARESPFNARSAPLPSASVHLPNPGAHPHPLSKSMQTASTSQQSTTSFSSADWETPQNFRNAKPNPAAFHSTGFVSKRGRMNNQPEPQSTQPDTPCKRSTLFPGSAFQTRVPGARIAMRELGSPGTPVLRGSVARRDSISTDDSDDLDFYGLRDQPGGDSLPPTPTKQPQNNASANKPFAMNKRPRTDSIDQRPNIYGRLDPPQTPAPKEGSVIPPDPSSLSISGKSYTYQPNKRHSMPLFPVTPAKELFANSSASRGTLTSRASFPDTPLPRPLDMKTRDFTRFASRFSDCKCIGTGEFSEVFRVVEKRAAPSSPFVFGTPSAAHRLSTPGALNPLYTSPNSHEETPKVFAVKRSKGRFHGQLDRAKQLEEAKILKSLGRHMHIIEYISSWEEDDHLCIQTEFCEGGSLDTWLAEIGNKGRLDEFRVWKIAVELLLGLEHIHNSGFMHLDLKPANILITHDGTLKICDFGMASAVPAPKEFEREGDRDYIAPEVLHFQRYDTPVDIFSLGLTIIETAGNEALPPGGPEWQALRSGDIGVAPVLSTNLSGEFVHRDELGNALATELLADPEDHSTQSSDQNFSNKRQRRNRLEYIRCIRGAELHKPRPGDLVNSPDFMAEGRLEEVVKAMISANPEDRPSASQLLQWNEIRWVSERRQKPATVFEGLWGPDDSQIGTLDQDTHAQDKDWDMQL